MGLIATLSVVYTPPHHTLTDDTYILYKTLHRRSQGAFACTYTMQCIENLWQFGCSLLMNNPYCAVAESILKLCPSLSLAGLLAHTTHKTCIYTNTYIHTEQPIRSHFNELGYVCSTDDLGYPCKLFVEVIELCHLHCSFHAVSCTHWHIISCKGHQNTAWTSGCFLGHRHNSMHVCMHWPCESQLGQWYMLMCTHTCWCYTHKHYLL